ASARRAWELQEVRVQVRFHATCGSELAHEEAGANAENLLISQSAFASKLAHKRRVGRFTSLHIKAFGVGA
ncbi:hypothetical protein A245_42280, partial [Pseudomonas syringae pv. actinidiae ICMP 19096]